MELYRDEGIRSQRHVFVELERDGSLRIDQVDSGALAEEMLGDWDHERILTIADPLRLVPYLLREGFAGNRLTFDKVENLAGEAGCKASCWVG